MKIFNTTLVGALFLSLFFSSCQKEKLEAPDFKRQTELLKTQEHELDKWILTEYTQPYNIEVIWRWNTKETQYNRNYIPPKEANVKPYLMILKGTFIKTYEEVMGKAFIKPLIPKQFHLLGEWGYNDNGTITLGQAETGSKFTFYGVNHWSEKDDSGDYPWIREAVHTMFHEFGHILHQNKKFTEDFEKVSKEHYTSNWNNESDLAARVKGFMSNYSMLNHNEDFVELIAFYTTLTPAQWNAMVNEGVEAAKAGKKLNKIPIKEEDAIKGRNAILTKITMVKDYLKTSWKIDLDEIRDNALKNAQTCYGNPEIFPSAATTSASSSYVVMSPFTHNHTYCNHVTPKDLKAKGETGK